MHTRLVHSPVAHALVLSILVAGVTVGSYLGLLGWGRRTATGVNAYLSTPWRGWHIPLLLGVLGVVALAVGWVGHPIIGSLVLATALTSCWSLDAALNVRGDRNWPIGMTLVGWASFGGAFLLSGVVAESRRVLRQRAEQARRAEEERQLAELRAAELARARAAQAARLAADHAAAVARAAQDALETQRREREAARLAAPPAGLDISTARRAKVVQAFRTSAAKVRSSSPKGRAKAS